jgi:DnaJ-class molecular chaperone
LKYHPDKNHENTQAAAEKFIQIQAAYEVLSDEQERAWYDSHREQILRGTDGDSASQDKAVVGTTVADLMKYFDTSTFSRMNDSPKVRKFYSIGEFADIGGVLRHCEDTVYDARPGRGGRSSGSCRTLFTDAFLRRQ